MSSVRPEDAAELRSVAERISRSIKSFLREANDELLQLVQRTPEGELASLLKKSEEEVQLLKKYCATQLENNQRLAQLELRFSDPDEDEVDPFRVEAKGENGIDYAKLIDKFGSKPIDEDLVARIEAVSGKVAHRWLRRGYFFSHRDMEQVLDCYESGEGFYLYTGRGPSSDSMHMGHMVPFLFTHWLQDAFDVPLVVQMTEDEKFLWGKAACPNVHRAYQLTRENAKDIIAVGFNVNKTFIFSDLHYVGHMYPNIAKIAQKTNVNTVKATFGFDDLFNVGQMFFPAVQAAPSFSSSFPHMFGADSNLKCLIPCAIDQDPYFRLTREVATKLGYQKPALIHSKFFPALQGAKTKMSASSLNSAIFLTDSEKVIRKKINKHAFSGGKDSIEEHRKLGANIDIDVSVQYLEFFLEDDAELEKIKAEYKAGRLLSGEVKKKLTDVLVPLVLSHQRSRALVTESVVDAFLSVRDMSAACK